MFLLVLIFQSKLRESSVRAFLVLTLEGRETTNDVCILTFLIGLIDTICLAVGIHHLRIRTEREISPSHNGVSLRRVKYIIPLC